MRSDLHDDLTAVAPTPSSRLDMTAVWRRGQQMRRRRHMLLAATSLASVAVAIVAIVALPGPDRGGGPSVAPVPSETENEDRQHVRLRAELRSLLEALEESRDEIRERRRALEDDVRALEQAGETERAREIERSIDVLNARFSELSSAIGQARQRLGRVRERLARSAASDVRSSVFFPTWTADDRPLAIVGGTLVEDRTCLLLRDHGEMYLPLWERGYTYADGTLRDESGGVVARVGDAVRGGGGYYSDVAYAEDLVGEPIPRRCRPEGAEPYVLIYDVSVEGP